LGIAEDYSGSGCEHSGENEDDDGKYTLKQFQDEVEGQYTTMPPQVEELYSCYQRILK